MENKFEWAKWLREKWANFKGDYEHIKDLDRSLDAAKVSAIAHARVAMREKEAQERHWDQEKAKKSVTWWIYDHGISTPPANNSPKFEWLSPKKTLAVTNLLKTITLDGTSVDIKNSTVTQGPETGSYTVQTPAGIYLKIDPLGVVLTISATKLENNVTITLKLTNIGTLTTPPYNKELTNKISSYIQTLPVGTLGIWVDKNGFIKITQWGNTVQMITNSEQVKIDWDTFIIRSSDWNQEEFNKNTLQWKRKP